MIDILATLAVLLHLHAPVMVDAGYVTPYADGLMQRVYERRVGWGHVEPDVTGCMAALNWNYIGAQVIVLHGDSVTRCYVVDCAQKRHVAERERAALVIEVDAESYRRIGYGPVLVIVVEARE
jgi:hypothetical protein